MGIFLKCVVIALVVINLDPTKAALKYLCNREHHRESQQQRIVGGKKSNISEHPYMAALVVKPYNQLKHDALQCGCTIISEHWVITAAHCLEVLATQNINKEGVYISAGNNDWRQGHKHTIVDMIGHKGYDADSMSNDVALIKVKGGFIRSGEVAISLASKNYLYPPNSPVKVLGWGLHAETESTVQVHLEEAEVIIYNQSHCRNLYNAQREVVTDSQFCAGDPRGGIDACQFDSGGPIVDNGILIGIVSWGIGCGQKQSPGVYSKVALVEDWVTEVSTRARARIYTKCGSGRSTLNRGTVRKEKRSASSSVNGKNFTLFLTLLTLIFK